MTLATAQRRMAALGLYSGPIDGLWGPQTDMAVSGALDIVETGRQASGSSMPPLPASYRWLLDAAMQPLPLTIQKALELYGTVEKAGAADSPIIMGWAAEVGLEAVYSADSIPWCGLFAAVVAKRAGKLVVDQPLWARNWAKFGVKADEPWLGDILVFSRGSGGHVGLYVGEDASAFHVLGGNQSDKVCFARIARNRLIAARRPPYRVPPASAKPYRLAAEGALSRNEA